MAKGVFDLEDRLVKFAGEVVKYCQTLPMDKAGKTIEDQVIRASISAALNYGEVQGTVSDKDFIHKMSLALKELKETRVGLKIAKYLNYGDLILLQSLEIENGELIAISAKRITNKQLK